jgi:inhibitor of KinA
MKLEKLTYKQFSSNAILIEWPAIISEKILNERISVHKSLNKHLFKVIVDIIPAYNSLLIIYKSNIENIYDAVSALKECCKASIIEKSPSRNLWKIPVCYASNFASDLKAISLEKGLSETALIQLHSSAKYTIHFMGFLPGFMYLSGLPKTLATPRKKTPDLHIKKGSVAIGENQTGVYPIDSPGGWNIIGNTPLNFFDIQANPPCFFEPGDQLIFQPISLEKHREITTAVANNSYKIENEILL